MYGLNTQDFNDNDSVDFDFFNSNEQIKNYANGNCKDSSQIITKAIIETQPLMLMNNMTSSRDLKTKQINSESTKILEDNCVTYEQSYETRLTKKSLSNCLAYANETVLEKNSDFLKFDDKEYSDNSLSDSTLTTITSELTSVSPCSLTSDSSFLLEESGDSSVSQNLVDVIETKPNDASLNKTKGQIPKQFLYESKDSDLCDQKLKGDFSDKYIYCPEISNGFECIKDKVNDIQLKQETSDISVIKEELECLSLTNQSSVSNFPKSPLCKGPSKIKMRKKESNLTFNREELLKIERDNIILLKKIMAHSKPKAVSLNYSFCHKKTSAAINRARQQKKIEQDNYVLYSKISAVGRMKKVF